jgi:ankyrin repeat protein
MRAAMHGNLEAVRYLVEKLKADHDTLNKNDENALILAVIG